MELRYSLLEVVNYGKKYHITLLEVAYSWPTILLDLLLGDQVRRNPNADESLGVEIAKNWISNNCEYPFN